VSAAPPAPGADPVGEAAARLRDELGLSFDGPLRQAFEAGLAAAALERGEPIEALIAAVCAGDPAACDLLIEQAVVRETHFYRHPDQLELVARLAGAVPAPLRLWSAGCATGEEAYSVAMALAEAGRPPGADLVLGTDVSARALAQATGAAYGARTLRFTPPSWVERWLGPPAADGARRVQPALGAGVRFERHNLLSPEPPAGAPFDVVLCRNVLIYFEPYRIEEALVRLSAALFPGGALVLGPVELPMADGTPLLPTAEAAGLRWAEDGGVGYLKKA
jgi:chemotaxis protein methyltransferase CheR